MKYLPLYTLILLITACGSRKPGVVTGDGSATAPTEAEMVTRRLIENQFNANWIDARASIKLDSREMNVGGTAYIRLEKNRQMWMSVKKFGFEVARALITPDSFYVLNRLQNEYVAEPLSYVEEKYKIPARFDLLQQIVLGNPIFLDRDLSVGREMELLHLTGANSRWKSEYWISDDSYHLQRMRLHEIREDRTLQVFMDDFRDVGRERPFSHRREVEIESPATGMARISLDFNRLEFAGPYEMPFSVPSRFDRGK